MAKAVAEGRRVVLVTGTRGEMGEIVVTDMDTPDNHRRLGEIRAGELERAMGAARRDRVGEPRLPRLGHDGPVGNHDPRSFWQADLDEAAGRLVWLDPALPARRHHDLQRVRRLRPPRPHPGPRRGGPGVRREPATRPGTRSSSRSRASSRGRRRSSTSRPSRRRSATAMRERLERPASRRFWAPPEDATPEQIAEFEESHAKMLVPDEYDHDLDRHHGDALERSGRRSRST